MELYIKVSGQKKAYVKEKVYRFGKMEASTKDTGRMIEPMVTED